VIEKAPEITEKRGYSEESEVYAIACSLFFLLFGSTDIDIDQTKTNIDLINTRSDLSGECRDFLLRNLSYDQKKRMDTEEAVKHPWLSLSEDTLEKGSLSMRVSDFELSLSIHNSLKETVINKAEEERKAKGLLINLIDKTLSSSDLTKLSNTLGGSKDFREFVNEHSLDGSDFLQVSSFSLLFKILHGFIEENCGSSAPHQIALFTFLSLYCTSILPTKKAAKSDPKPKETITEESKSKESTPEETPSTQKGQLPPRTKIESKTWIRFVKKLREIFERTASGYLYFL
jgi:serine/threonine protein kinase